MRHQLCNIVTLNLNTTCNLHCKWCYNQEKQHKLLKFELFVKFYDDIIKNNVTTMTLIGGEPTIHPQFMEILRKLEKQEVHLFTNAIRFSEKKFCEDVCKQKNLKDITISIKGFNEKSFKEFSDEISFVEFCSAIENLKEKGTFIRVNYNCTENLSQSMVSDFAYFLRYYGLHEIVLHDIRPYITESGESYKGNFYGAVTAYSTGTGESRNCSLHTFKPAVLSLQSDLFETIFGFKKSNGYMCCEETTGNFCRS